MQKISRTGQANNDSKTYVADFETTTDPLDCRIWCWCAVNAYDVTELAKGITLDSFVKWVSETASVCYFHNLAFDGHFLLDWLLKHGYTHTLEQKLKPGQLASLISKEGKVYSIKVRWENGNQVEFRDSLKKLPMSVAEIARSFKLPETKGEIDYDAYRPIGYEPTPEEWEYVRKDVVIVASALRQQLDEGMTKLTVGADSLAQFIAMVGAKPFRRLFPILDETIDASIRRAYRGGWTYANPAFTHRILPGGHVYDVNSLYPSVMAFSPLPYGEPLYSVSPLTADGDVWVACLTITAKLREGYLPCIQIKGSSRFAPTEYLSEISEPTEVYCTSVDFELWCEHYELEVLAYNGCWSFHATRGLFDDYIEKYMAIKATTDDPGLRMIAKLHLNSLYGKFATNPDVTPRIPTLEDDVVQYRLGDTELREPVYTPLGVLITAYARQVTITAAQQHYERFAYADTDSLHIIGEPSSTLDIDAKRLGAWKHELEFRAAYYVRAKCYTEQHLDGRYETHIAGLPKQVAEQVTFDDYTNGRTFPGKYRPVKVPGGIVLQDVGFTLNL